MTERPFRQCVEVVRKASDKKLVNLFIDFFYMMTQITEFEYLFSLASLFSITFSILLVLLHYKKEGRTFETVNQQSTYFTNDLPKKLDLVTTFAAQKIAKHSKEMTAQRNDQLLVGSENISSNHEQLLEEELISQIKELTRSEKLRVEPSLRF